MEIRRLKHTVDTVPNHTIPAFGSLGFGSEQLESWALISLYITCKRGAQLNCKGDVVLQRASLDLPTD